jgi:tetratricopeptide (TPR) repeat protein
MSDASYIAKLSASIENYAAEIRRDPDAKDTLPDALRSLPALPRTRLAAVWPDLPPPDNLLGLYSYAKHALWLCVRDNCLTEVSEHVPAWVRACVEAGAYEDCKVFSRECIDSRNLCDRLGTGGYLSVLFSRAKALRNLGSFAEAQLTYRHIIELAAKRDAQVDLSFGLLFIGKLYGNYLGQRSLFASFVDEAKRKLHLLDGHVDYTQEQERIERGIALCYDSLGQAHRAFDPYNVDWMFLEARNRNRKLGRPNGVSRALCHLYYLGFKRSGSRQDKADNLDKFIDEGMRPLTEGWGDERGLAVRSIQCASMLHEMGQTRAAREYLESGKSLARIYSQHKTLVEAAKVESEVYLSSDPERAVGSLRKARADALKYNLALQESDINRRLADLSMTHGWPPLGNGELRPVELLRRNRDIFMDLIRAVQKMLPQLDSSEGLEAEFRLLSENKSRYREKLLLDYKQIIEKFDENFLSLLALSAGTDT